MAEAVSDGGWRGGGGYSGDRGMVGGSCLGVLAAGGEPPLGTSPGGPLYVLGGWGVEILPQVITGGPPGCAGGGGGGVLPLE